MTEHVYKIVVEGHLDSRWADWFEGLIFTYTQNGNTVMLGRIVDQAALHGILNKLCDLGLTLLFLKRLEQEFDPGLVFSPNE